MRTHIERGRELTIAEVQDAILAKVKRYREGKWQIKSVREMEAISPDRLRQIAGDLVELNAALMSGRSVFAVCDKAPRNLDSGNHYYSVFYTNAMGEVIRLWTAEFTPFLGGVRQDRDRNLMRWIWCSGVIGMSRVLDATNGIFSFLRELGGCYAQIDVI